MEGTYQPGFYNTERGEQDSRHPPSLPPQQQQQHATHYPVELPIPYHTTSQHQSEFVADQPLRTFPISHPVGPVLRSIYESAPMLPNSNIVQQVHQQPTFPLRGHRVKSSANHAPSITTLEPLGPHLPGETLALEPSSKNIHSTERRKQCPSSPPSNNSKSSKVISSSQELPRGLSFKLTSGGKVEGVVAKETIGKGAEFGPITGTLTNEDVGWSKDSSWEICMPGGLFFYIDGPKDWMSHLRCAQTEEEQNMEAFQCYGDIFFRSTQVIEPGSELRVFYSKKYKKRVGIETRLQDLRFNHDAMKFQCSLCEGLFSSSKLILRHIRCEHTITTCRPDEMNPVLTWKNKKKKSAEADIIAKQLLIKETKTRDREELVFKCITCEKVFPSRGRLNAHEMFHDYSEEHACPVCGKRHPNAQTLGKHRMTHEVHNEPKLYQCKKCSQKCKSKTALYRHEKDVHGYTCRVCSERFSSKRECLRHEQTHERQLSPEPPTDEPKDMLGKSSKYYLEQRPFKCRFCPKRYVVRKKVNEHEKEAHMLEGAFKCSLCPKVFTNECRLNRHVNCHKQNRMYCCTLCPRTFASESALNNHQGEHTGLKPFKCDVCGRGFRIKKTAYAHKRRVHGERQMRFFCSVCNKGFCKKGELLIHERRHKGIRPYVCLECGKAFTGSCALTAHKKALHTAEKAFSCEICGKTFSLNQHYTYHMFKHRAQGDESLCNGIQQ